MKYTLPEISWHGDRLAILSVDIRPQELGAVRLASSDTVRDIRLWDLSPAEKTSWDVDYVATLQGHDHAVNVVRWSPDGRRLASADAVGAVCIWEQSNSEAPDLFAKDDEMPPNKESWSIVKRLRKHVEDVADLTWAPDGNRLASVSVDKSLIVWDVTTGKSVQTVSFELFQQGLAWDPLGEVLASLGNDRFLHILDVSSKPNKISRLRKIGKAKLRTPKAGLEVGCDEEKAEWSHLFHDSSLMAFVRRPSWSPCGQLLFAPSGQFWASTATRNASYVFTRSGMSSPALVLPCPDKPSVVIRACPRLFRLRDGEKSLFDLPYRVVWVVVSQESLIFYSSATAAPFAYVANVHLCALTDAAWAPDGRLLVASSKDGYCSLVSLDEEELGLPLDGPAPVPDLPCSLIPQKPVKTPKLTPKAAATPASEGKGKKSKDSETKPKEKTEKSIVSQLQSSASKTPSSSAVKTKSPKSTTPSTPKRVRRGPPDSADKKTRGITSFFKQSSDKVEDDDIQVIPTPTSTPNGESGTSEKTPKRVSLKTLGPVEAKEDSLHTFETSAPPDFSRTNFGPPPAATPSPAAAGAKKQPRRVKFTTLA